MSVHYSVLGERATDFLLPNGSFAVHEEGRGEAEDAVAACREAVGVEQWHEPIKAELVEEETNLIARP